MLSLLLSNMKLLWEIIHHQGLINNQYADDIQLYLSTPGELGNAVNVLSQCLKAMRSEQQIEWLWVLGPSVFETLPSLILDWMALSQIYPTCKLGVKEQIVISRKPFAQLWVVHHLYSFLDRESLLTVTHIIVTSLMDYSNAFHMELP